MMLVMRTSKGVVAVPILAGLVVRGKWWRKCRRVCSPTLPRGPLEQRGSLLHLHPHRRGVFVIPHGVRADVDDEYAMREDRKSTRLNSSHVKISYAVF